RAKLPTDTSRINKMVVMAQAFAAQSLIIPNQTLGQSRYRRLRGGTDFVDYAVGSVDRPKPALRPASTRSIDRGSRLVHWVRDWRLQFAKAAVRRERARRAAGRWRWRRV